MTALQAGWSYWLDFIWVPVVAALITALTCRSVGWVAMAAAGVVLFGVVEYWLHRSVLHRWLWSGYHERHHLHPEEYVVFPLWWLPVGFSVLLLIFPYSLWTGFLLGYGLFLLTHHLLHHVEHANHQVLSWYARMHLRHHDGEAVNYGISPTSVLWDRVFGTYRSPA